MIIIKNKMRKKTQVKTVKRIQSIQKKHRALLYSQIKKNIIA